MGKGGKKYGQGVRVAVIETKVSVASVPKLAPPVLATVATVSQGRQQQSFAISEAARQTVSVGLSEGLPALVEGQEEDHLSESESESASLKLGDEDTIECTPGVRQKGPEKNTTLESFVPETEASGEVSSRPQQVGAPQKASFASLFAGNRQPINGGKLEQIDFEEGSVTIEVESAWSPWQFCLVGYFGGRFPGKVALQQIVEAWKVHVNIHFHNSGWIIFKFDNEESQLQVMQGSPYIVFGKPLLLKIMSQFFRFENEELSKFPVWVQLRNLPLALWGSSVLSKICSRLGKPICTDKLTAHRERVSYARALVEIDVAKEVKHSVKLVLPNGNKMEQSIFYENLPRFCSHCKVVGHSLESCKAQERAEDKFKKVVAARVRPNKAGPESGADTLVPLVDTTNGATHVQQSTIGGPSSATGVAKEAGPQLVPLGIMAAEQSTRVGPMANVGQVVQLTDVQLQARGKNKVEELQFITDKSHSVDAPLPNKDGLTEMVIRKKNKRKDKKKKGKLPLADFCADVGGGSPNLGQ